MKTFKKLAAFLLSVSMCASVAGCGFASGNTNNSGNSGTNNSSSTTDNSGAGNQDDASGAAYIAALESQLKAANTVKMSVVISTEMEEGNNSYYWQEVKMEYTFAKTEIGYNAYLKLTTQDLYEKGGVPETEIEEQYIIDGLQYYYDEYEGCYVPSEGYISTGLSSIVDFSNVMSEEESAQLRELLAQAFDETVEVTNSQAMFSNDLTDDMNGLLDYIGAIDPETKTMGSVVNDAIALFAEGVTLQGILAEIEALDTITVGQAESAIDEYLQENADMSLQEFKKALLEDERILSLLTEAGVDLEMIAQLKQMTLKDILGYSADDSFDEFVYDVIMMITASENAEEGVEDELPTYEEFIAGLEGSPYDSTISYLMSVAYAFCEVSVGEFLESLGAVDVEESLQMYQNIDFTEAVIGATITFGNMLNISSATMFLRYGCAGLFPVDVDTTAPVKATASIVCTIHSISAQQTTITLPSA